MTIEKSYIKVEISRDEMEAHLTLDLPLSAPEPVLDEIIEKVKEYGISGPILKDKIREIISEKKYGEPVLICRGKKVKPTVHGRIELLYPEPGAKPPSEEKGRIDHHERNSIVTVSKGEEIARLHPPVKGEEGTTVTGKTIVPSTGKEKILKSGKNTEFSQNDKNLLIATENGAVKFIDNNKLLVEPVMNIKGDVDYSVGNIDFTGSVIIRGNVLSGFKVRATGSIEIEGVVEDSEIVTGGDAYINGCTGKQRGSVKSGGTIFLKFAENHIFHAAGDIIVKKYLMNCRAQADGSIILKDSEGLVVGGETIAAEKIHVKNAGNDEGTKTVLASGFSSDLRQNLSMLDLEQNKNINSLGTVNQALKRISRMAIIKKALPPEIKKQIGELVKTKEIIEDRIKELSEKQEDLLRESEKCIDSTIIVSSTLLPGVTVRFPDSQKIIREKLDNVKFRAENNRIITIS